MFVVIFSYKENVCYIKFNFNNYVLNVDSYITNK